MVEAASELCSDLHASIWRCGEMDWNVIGYVDLVRGQHCNPEERDRVLGPHPEWRAAVMSPTGQTAVVANDNRIGLVEDGGVRWLFRKVDCGKIGHKRCIERL